MRTIFCLICHSGCCTHLQESHVSMFTARELSILRALLDPEHDNVQSIADHLGLTCGSLKQYLTRMYAKLARCDAHGPRYWCRGSQRQLVLWALTYREQLGFAVPCVGE